VRPPPRFKHLDVTRGERGDISFDFRRLHFNGLAIFRMTLEKLGKLLDQLGIFHDHHAIAPLYLKRSIEKLGHCSQIVRAERIGKTLSPIKNVHGALLQILF